MQTHHPQKHVDKHKHLDYCSFVRVSFKLPISVSASPGVDCGMAVRPLSARGQDDRPTSAATARELPQRASFLYGA
jgi:hypothetical protein